MRYVLTALALVAAAPAAAEQVLPDPAAEARAQEVMRDLRCVVCQHESIAESGADMAVDMRGVVRARLAAGDTPEGVRAYLVSRYGAWVDFRPPVQPATWPLWLAPIAFLVAGAFAARHLFARPRA